MTARRRTAAFAPVAVALFVASGAAIGVATRHRGDAPPAVDRSALLAFERSFVDVAEHLSYVLEPQLGGDRTVKGALGPIERGEMTADDIDAVTVAWTRSLRSAREQARAITAPPALIPARSGLVASVNTYLDAVTRVASTKALAVGPDRTALIDAAVAAGAQADRTYDAAAARVQEARRSVGLASNPRLPDPSRTLPAGVVIEGSG